MSSNHLFYSYGSNLPISFKLNHEDGLLQHDYSIHHFSMQDLKETDCLYLFRKINTLTENTWVIKMDLYECLNEAIQYYEKECVEKEDVLVHIISHFSKEQDPDQISIFHFLQRPSHWILNMFYNCMLSGMATERDAITNSIEVWQEYCKEEIDLIKKYPFTRNDLQLKVKEYDMLYDVKNIDSIDEFFQIVQLIN